LALLLATLGGFSYEQSRWWLWHKNRPRYPRFLYKFRSLQPQDGTSLDRLRDVPISALDVRARRLQRPI
jgi:hypothetical protein